MYSCTLATPTGPFSVVATDDAVIASGWTADIDWLLNLVAPSLRPDSARHRADLGPFSGAVEDYFAGDVTAIDAVPVQQRSGPFLEAVWRTLREIKPGYPVTYLELSRLSGRPAAVRAAAQGCARNAVALIVPCHRVVRTGGGLGGFGYGLPVKQWLLDHEGAA